MDAADQEALKADGPRSPNVMLGNHDAVLFRGEGDDGFSLVRAWFGPHYVLPRHSHDGDCLYYVVEGSLTMGSQVIEAGDGFFVPSDAPYGYEAGPEGVVVLEFRSRTSFGMQIPGGQLERWRRMAVVADENAEQWAERQAQTQRLTGVGDGSTARLRSSPAARRGIGRAIAERIVDDGGRVRRR